jgi:hypothetical protein
MRTMRNAVVVFVVGGVLLFASQSAQACHGRKNCLRCCAKGYSGSFGSANYGYAYGTAYGYSPNYGWAYSNPASYGRNTALARRSSDEGDGSSEQSADATLSERLRDLENRFDINERSSNERPTNRRTLPRSTDQTLRTLEDLGPRLTSLEHSIKELTKALNAHSPPEHPPATEVGHPTASPPVPSPTTPPPPAAGAVPPPKEDKRREKNDVLSEPPPAAGAEAPPAS